LFPCRYAVVRGARVLIPGELRSQKKRRRIITRAVSRAANRSIGIMKRKKKIEITAKPFAARV